MKKAILFFVTLNIILLSNPSSAVNNTGNARIAPLSLAVGLINVETDIVVNRHWSVAPMLSYWDLSLNDELEFQATGYGIRADWYPYRANRQGFFSGVFYKRWQVDVTKIDQAETDHQVALNTFAAYGGYRWMWKSFNVTAEAGYRMAQLEGFDLTVSSGEDNTVEFTDISMFGGLLIDMSVGWAF